MSGTIFFILSKTLDAVLQFETWLVVLLCVALFALYRGRLRRARRALWTAVVIVCVFGVVPVGDFLLAPLESRYPVQPNPSAIDGIIVLSGAEDSRLTQIWSQSQVGESADRLIAATALANLFPGIPIALSGGSGALGGSALAEAEIARIILTEAGVAPGRIILETGSRNTYENATGLRDLIDAGEDRWLLVTSASHMTRSAGIFCHLGWRVVPYPVDFRSGRAMQNLGWNLQLHLRDFNVGLREWVGIAVYRALGRMVWPDANCTLAPHIDEARGLSGGESDGSQDAGKAGAGID